jgi:hypothetical protein
MPVESAAVWTRWSSAGMSARARTFSEHSITMCGTWLLSPAQAPIRPDGLEAFLLM